MFSPSPFPPMFPAAKSMIDGGHCVEGGSGSSGTGGGGGGGGGRRWKVCGVCGDRAKSFHFGGISCDSCKAFFRRSVQNEAFRSFRCAFQGRCDITMANRKCCQHCRFNKCLDIGMETSWVMSEEERVHLMHSRMTSRHFYNRINSGHQRVKMADAFYGAVEAAIVDDVSPISTSNEAYLTPNETVEVDLIVGQFNSNFRPELDERENAKTLLVTEFVTSVQKLVKFSRQIPRFCRLSSGVQVALLRANIFEMFVVLHVISRATGRRLSPEVGGSNCYLCAFLSHASALSVTLRSTVNDTPTLVLFLMVILFSADSLPLPVDDRPQLYYCHLLEKYFRGQWTSDKGHALSLPKLLLLLPTLREIRDKHMSHPFQPCGHH